ncbi:MULTISPECIES: DUF4350 domain-containing protein [Thermoactinomyces]|jgi:Domain of unknown function (DUF4350)|uniref:DUF4350 domain-containing protein n=1 Tax=Thermoactinomyces daqus TaxID=1329516 RepID=A0A7W1XC94_9BACL|nr:MULTISPECIES: DUF4350 domain-containing protein [Thermoactinomyces]MBA4543877.1 DUF4350 domain-containing protein [Thermoactinomyces daqus]MBH8605165.1 DUF4350 domain-containing protein [Thermoactinomyces sp. CICC 10522]MBH8608295.1 DUF4350 domain-containing protein [Thermoactinomyces sp. CICC 10521]
MRKNKIGIGIVLAIIACFLAGLIWLEWSNVAEKVPWSSQNPEPTGVKALSEFLSERGVPAKPLETENNLPSGSGNTLMFVNPQTNKPNPERLRALLNWVSRGNQVVLWSAPDSDWSKAFRFSGQSCRFGEEYVRVKPQFHQEWLDEVQFLSWKSATCIAPRQGIIPVLKDDQNHLLVGYKQSGQGRIVYVPDPSIIANKNIDKADHIALLLWMVSNPFQKAVWFDETSHSLLGQGEAPSTETDELPPIQDEGIPEPSAVTFLAALGINGGFVLVQIVLLTLLWLFARGKRFASPRMEQVVEKRDSMEYIDAMSRLYRRSNLRMEALLFMKEQLHLAILQKLRMRGHESEAELLHQLEVAMGSEFRRNYENIARLIQDAADADRKLTSYIFVEWSRTLRKLRKEIEQWGVTSSTLTASKR